MRSSPQSGDRVTDDLALAKLLSSGLDWTDAAQLGMAAHPSAAALEKAYPGKPGLSLSYLDPWTLKPLTFRPCWPAYIRVRLLDLPATGFDAQTDLHAPKPDGKKPMPKYLQPADSGVMAYFPASVPWPEILSDPGEPLIITEGELKAAKACKEGFATIGLGGVSSFQSARYGLVFLPELEKINWVKRRVFVIYDSDIMTKPNVVKALNDLSAQLVERGALPYIVILPPVNDNGKTGLDDFLMARPAKALQELMDTEAMPLTIAIPLWQMNNDLVSVRSPAIVLEKRSLLKMSPTIFRDFIYANRMVSEQTLKESGTVSMASVPAAGAWLKWPLRSEVEKLTYSPGDPQLINPETGSPAWNMWPGWGVGAAEGDVQPFLELVDHLFKGAAEEAKQWFMQWLAYPLQYPGTKLFTSVLLWGVKHGTGKSLVGETMGKIYGDNYTELNQVDLYNGFNEWAENKQFVMGDDVTGTDKRHDSDRLKKFITQSQLRLNIKHVPSFVIPDCINYYFTANQPTALFLEDDDRRSFVHEITAGPMDEEFYMEYRMWKDSSKGPSALFWYLLNKVDVGNFNPSAPAMRTEAKERMIADVRSDLGEWVNHLVSCPEEVLKVGNIPMLSDLFTNRELLQLYDPTGKTYTTAGGLGRELRRVGITFAVGGKKVSGPNGQDRYYIIRNRERWSAVQQTAEVTAHVNAKHAEPAKPKY